MIVSIIIPIYNREAWVDQMFQRLLDLQLECAEVIIVDDGSTDGTLERLQQFSTKKFELKIFSQKNSGPATARNLGFSHSTGKYIQYLDSDDFLTPNKISEQIQYMEIHPEVEVVYGSWRMGEFWESAKVKRAQDNQDMVVNLLEGKFNPNFSYLFRRKVIENVGGWGEKHSLNDDFDFALRIAASGAIFHCVAELTTGFYQWHPYERLSRQSDTANARATYPMIENAMQLCKGQNSLSPVRTAAFSNYVWQLAVKALPDSEEVFYQGLAKSRKIDEAALPQTLVAKLFGLKWYAHFINSKTRIKNLLKKIAIGIGVRKFMRAIRKINVSK